MLQLRSAAAVTLWWAAIPGNTTCSALSAAAGLFAIAAVMVVQASCSRAVVSGALCLFPGTMAGLGWIEDVLAATLADRALSTAPALPAAAALLGAFSLGLSACLWAATSYHRRTGASLVWVVAGVGVAFEASLAALSEGAALYRLAYTQFANPVALQLASVVGAAGTSAAVYAINGWCADCALRGPTSVGSVLVVLLLAASVFAMARARPSETTTTAAVVQWPAAARLDSSPAELEPSGADLIVWPETVYRHPAAWRRGVLPTLHLAASRGPARVIGARLLPAPRRGCGAYNAAIVVDEAGTVGAVHLKRRLAPGVERLHYCAGEDDETPTRVGVLICFEILFSGDAVAQARRGARILALPSSDRFQGGHVEPLQQVAVASLRAAETGLFVLRASTSHSAIVDPWRGPVALLPHGEPGAAIATVALRASDTAFVRAHGLPALEGLVTSLLVVALAVRRPGRRGHSGAPVSRHTSRLSVRDELAARS